MTDDALRRHHRAVHALAVMDHGDLPVAIATTVRLVAEALGVARAGVWVYDRDHTAIQCRGLMHQGIYSIDPLVLDGASHPRYFAALRTQRTIVSDDACGDPRTREFRDGYLQPLGITAMIDAGITVAGEAIGVICAEQVGAPRRWSEDEAELMTAAAAMLAIAFTLERQRSLEDQLRQSQKMELLGHLAGGIAHDVNDMLNVVLGEAELLEDFAPQGVLREGITAIRDSARTGAGLTHKLLSFARQRPVSIAPVDVNAVLIDFEGLARRAAGEAVSVVVRHAERPIHVLGDEPLLQQMLLNLVVNARQAMPDGGTLVLSVEQAPPDTIAPDVSSGSAKGYARITVADSGVGMTKETAARIWEPFFTTRELGSGLGLAIVHGAIRQMRGFATVHSDPGKGTTFQVHLPLLEALHPAPAVRTVATSIAASAHLLLAEDEPDVRRVLATTLRRAGYQVTEAKDGEQALALFTRHPSAYDLLVSDVVMPVMDGPTAFERMQAIRPGLSAVFLSGYAPEPHRLDRLAADGSALIQLGKPIERARLLGAISELLADREPSRATK